MEVVCRSADIKSIFPNSSSRDLHSCTFVSQKSTNQRITTPKDNQTLAGSPGNPENLFSSFAENLRENVGEGSPGSGSITIVRDG